MSHGIDYSGGTANFETGIHFGIIPINKLNDHAWESFEGDYGEPTCPKCGQDPKVVGTNEDAEDVPGDCDSEYYCPNCSYGFDSDEAYGEEPIFWNCTDDDYKAFVDSSNDTWVLKSPYYTFAQFCSPCAPGACYLLDPCEGYVDSPNKCYCFGTDWFEDNRPPYPVYRVDNSECIFRPEVESD